MRTPNTFLMFTITWIHLNQLLQSNDSHISRASEQVNEATPFACMSLSTSRAKFFILLLLFLVEISSESRSDHAMISRSFHLQFLPFGKLFLSLFSRALRAMKGTPFFLAMPVVSAPVVVLAKMNKNKKSCTLHG